MKVVKLIFKEKGEEYFFTSYAAIYDRFTSEDIGVGKNSIWYKMRKHGFYENDKVHIKPYPLTSKKR